MTALAPVPALRSRISGLTAESVFVGRSLLHSLRDGESLVMAIMLPVLLMVLFTYVFGGAIDPTGGYVDYVVPGIILLCAGFGAASTAVYVANDMKAGIIDRFRTMPLRASAVLTGHVVASLLRNLLATGVVIGVALLVGFRPTAGAWGWVGAIAVMLVLLCTCLSRMSNTCDQEYGALSRGVGGERSCRCHCVGGRRVAGCFLRRTDRLSTTRPEGAGFPPAPPTD